MTREEFEAAARSGGYGPAREVQFAPDSEAEEHTHEQESFLLVLEGTFGLRTADGHEVFGRGQTCTLPAGVPHQETAGPFGARILLARR